MSTWGSHKRLQTYPLQLKLKETHALWPSSTLQRGHVPVGNSSEQQPCIGYDMTSHLPFSVYQGWLFFPEHPYLLSHCSARSPSLIGLNLAMEDYPNGPFQVAHAFWGIHQAQPRRISAHTDFRKGGAATCEHLIYHSNDNETGTLGHVGLFEKIGMHTV